MTGYPGVGKQSVLASIAEKLTKKLDVIKIPGLVLDSRKDTIYHKSDILDLKEPEKLFEKILNRFDRSAWHLHYNLADIGPDVGAFMENVAGGKSKFIQDYIGDFRQGSGLKYFTRTPKEVAVKPRDDFGKNIEFRSLMNGHVIRGIAFTNNI